MTDAQKAGGADDKQPAFGLVSQFARDLSFECPQGPGMNQGQEKDLNLEVGLALKGAGENLHEVALRMRATAKNTKNENIYMVDLEYVGVYHAENVPQDRLGSLLAIDGAAIIFPFARQIMMNAIEFGGFRAPLIDPVNFAHLYMQAQQRNQAAEAPTTDGAPAQA